MECITNHDNGIFFSFVFSDVLVVVLVVVVVGFGMVFRSQFQFQFQFQSQLSTGGDAVQKHGAGGRLRMRMRMRLRLQGLKWRAGGIPGAGIGASLDRVGCSKGHPDGGSPDAGGNGFHSVILVWI